MVDKGKGLIALVQAYELDPLVRFQTQRQLQFQSPLFVGQNTVLSMNMLKELPLRKECVPVRVLQSTMYDA